MSEFKLHNQNKINTGFKIPEGYFDSLSQNIFTKLQKEEPKVIPFYAKKTTWILTAAAVILILISLPLLNSNQQQFEQISTIELEEYVEHQAIITDNDIAILFEDESLEDIILDLKINEDELEETLSKEFDLESYLIN